MGEDDLLRPLWHYPVRWATFEAVSQRWSYLSPSERQARRSGWTRGRRLVRPVGLLILWAGVVGFVVGIDQPSGIGRAVWFAALLPFAVVGLREWLRDGATHHRRRVTGDGLPATDGRATGDGRADMTARHR